MHDREIAAADASTGSARTVLMLRPAAFSVNPQAAASNAFQRSSALPGRDLQALVLREFDRAHLMLEQAGVEVICLQDSPEPAKPDAVFPNNWVTFHADGTAILYPMAVANRRSERRLELLDSLRDRYGFNLRSIIDLSALEQQEQFLEGTGSLVLDRRNGLAYAALSARTRPVALQAFSERTGYRLSTFDTADNFGIPVYHTNVMLSIGSTFAMLCAEAISDPHQRRIVRDQLTASGREIVDISLAQMASFAGNLLQLDTAGGSLLAISAAAVAMLEPPQRKSLERHGQLLPVTLPHIETGGGSIRCMLAEIFLPRA